MIYEHYWPVNQNPGKCKSKFRYICGEININLDLNDTRESFCFTRCVLLLWPMYRASNAILGSENGDKCEFLFMKLINTCSINQVYILFLFHAKYYSYFEGKWRWIWFIVRFLFCGWASAKLSAFFLHRSFRNCIVLFYIV